MKNDEILAGLCTEVIGLLHQMYMKGEITRETYVKHSRVKLLYLRSCNPKNQQGGCTLQ